MLQNQNLSPTFQKQPSLKPLLKKTSAFQGSEKRENTGRRLSFSDENGGNLAKVSLEVC